MIEINGNKKYINLFFITLVPFLSIIGCNNINTGTEELSSQKAITALSINYLDASIDEITKMIEITLPGTDITSLYPIIQISDKATISPFSRVANDFSLPKTYTVTAEDGSHIEYIVTVNINHDIYSEIKWLDISSEKTRHVVIAQGTPDLYNGHPTTVMLDDNKTIFATWTKGHGGTHEFLAMSKDAGLSWESLPVPEAWSTVQNCPSIYKLTDKMGVERLMIFTGAVDGVPSMIQTYSDDYGKSWSPIISLNKENIMPFTSIIQIKNGNYLGLYTNSYYGYNQNALYQSVSEDGGLTWSDSQLVGKKEGMSVCEPCVIRSPNGLSLICIARENNRKGPSLIMYSDNEGDTWTDLYETTWFLTGDRHIAKYTPDGRLVIVFRDQMIGSPYYNHFVAWVGTYEDILLKKQGQYRIKLLHSYAGWDCGYPGLEILPDGTIIATTYIKYESNENQHSIVSARFNLMEFDNK